MRTITVQVPVPEIGHAKRWTVQRCGSPGAWLPGWLAIDPRAGAGAWFPTQPAALAFVEQRTRAEVYDEQLSDATARWGIDRSPSGVPAEPPRRRGRPSSVTDVQVRRMRELRSQGWTQRAIADDLGVDVQVVGRCLRKSAT